MKDRGLNRRYQNKLVAACILVTLTALLVINIGAVLASSGEESSGEHAAPKGWIATDTFRVMNFSVLAIVLFFLLKKPLSQALSGRIKGIKEQLEELEEKKSAAEKQLVAYTDKLSLLEGEAEKIIQDYVKQGEEAKKRILTEAEDSASKLEEQAKKLIEHEFEQAKAQLREEVMQRALAEAEEIIKKKITAKDQERLVDEYLQKVEA